MKFCYADPPYLGMSKHYPEHPESHIWDDLKAHANLIQSLDRWFHGWALSTGSAQLQQMLMLCPTDVRIAAWVKPWASWKPGVHPAYAWEPVIFRTSPRKRTKTEPTARDWVAASATRGRPTKGAKPDEFNRWIRALLGVRDGVDELVDLFPGTGGLGKELAQTQLVFV